MTVCKYFMQGNCRYGDKCHYEHPSGDSQGFAYSAQRQLFGGGRGGGGGGGGGGGNKYKWDRRQQNPQQNSPQSSSSDVINTLIGEIKTWEDSKMWPFSCIAFEKEGPCVPEFTDMSAEELRYAAYEANKTGGLQTYMNHVQNLVQDYSSKRQVLKNPTMTVKQKMMSLIEEYRNKKNRSNDGGGSSTMSLFSNSGSGSFGTTNRSSTNPFGGGTGNTTFGGGSSSATFGGGTGSATFGGGSGSATFGASGGNTSVFGGGTSTGAFSTPSAGAFGQGSGTAGHTTFGQSTGTPSNSFPSQPSNTNPFGAASAQPSTATANPFGSGNASGTTFGTNNPGAFSSTFGKTSPAANLFNVSSQSGPSVGHTQPFGASNNAFGTTAGGNVVTAPSGDAQRDTTQNTVYTPLEKLTKEELEAYNATTFTLGKIPTKPPPKELVF